MLVRAARRMEFMAPRTRQWNQTPVSDPITTSPIMAAVGAMKASSAICGVTPSREKTGPYGQVFLGIVSSGIVLLGIVLSGIQQLPSTYACVQTEHEGDVLDGGTGCPFAEVVQARDQHRLTVFFVGVDRKFQPVGVVQRLGFQFAVGCGGHDADQVAAGVAGIQRGPKVGAE